MNRSTNPQKLRPLSIAVAALLIYAVCVPAQTDANPPGLRVGNMTRHGLAGVVTSINGSAIVMEIPENVTFTVQIAPSTQFTSAGQSAAATDIHPGDPILAHGDIDEQARTIQAVAIAIQAPLAARMFENLRATFGKTWTAGIITAVRDNSITVQRRDGQAQTFTVDDRTTWRLNDREASFAMIRVGESIRVQLRPGASAASQVSIQGIPHPN